MNLYVDNSYMQNNPEPPDTFPLICRLCGIIAMVLGILSITTCCLGFLSIPVGALGILFGVLSRRLGKRMPSASVVGIVLSSVGAIAGIIMFIYVMLASFSDPEVLREAYEMYEEIYGYELEESTTTPYSF